MVVALKGRATPLRDIHPLREIHTLDAALARALRAPTVARHLAWNADRLRKGAAGHAVPRLRQSPQDHTRHMCGKPQSWRVWMENACSQKIKVWGCFARPRALARHTAIVSRTCFQRST